MAKVDMHCHSKYSKHPSEWFLQRIGAAESYTEPDFIYQTAKSRGMDFVTVTDHNNMDASYYLTQKYPDTFTGVESTVYFPEDGCKVHILVYGQTPEQFEMIQKVRRDIYDFREYIKEQNLAYSVAHATFSVNGKIRLHHLEKMMLLFDVFEGINGGRGKLHNTTWVRTLENLSPLAIENLYSRYRIEPISNNPWVKGFTGGSDDHAGLFLGKTYTTAKAESPDEYLENVKKRECRHAGRYSDFHSLAFTVYKIAHDFSKTKKSVHFAGGFFSKITNYIFEQERPTFIERVKMQGFKMKSSAKSAGKVNNMLVDLINEMNSESFDNIEKKLNIVYHKSSDIADEYFKMMVGHMAKDIEKINMDDLYRSVTTALPALFLSIPFFSSFNQIYKDRELINELDDKFNYGETPRRKRILWFTDTINDLNGVSVTLRTIGKLCDEKGYDLKLVSCLTEDEIDHRLPPNLMNLKPITHFKLPYYEKLQVKIPSVIRALEDIYEFEPDEVYISTPGPVGLVGLLASRLLSVKSTGIYHTDFTGEVQEIVKNDSLTNLVEAYTRWFFDSVTELKTTSRQYIDYLERRGISRHKMSVFSRGIDAKLFRPVAKKGDAPMTLCYAGRVSKDKNLKFFFDIFDELEQKYDLRLIIAGHGPYSDAVERYAEGRDNIIVKGEIEHSQMPDVYGEADLFVFPSNTDTFGMVVLESQACGVAGVVSDMGGPKEIIEHGKTGYAVAASDYKAWTERLTYMIELYHNDRDSFDEYGRNARERVLQIFNWDAVLEELFTRRKSDWRVPAKAEIELAAQTA